MLSDNLNTYLVIAIMLLALGVFGMIRHKTFIGMLISSEFILSGASLNFMAFNRFLAPNPAVGRSRRGRQSHPDGVPPASFH